MTIPQMNLPDVLPVFPLTGVMLLPGTVLPLHIFEPRYRNMVEDALDGDKVFGMIQPFAPQNDNRGPQPDAANAAPDLYKVGCAGLIEKSENLADGRFFVQLKGVNRFRFTEEFSLQRGYRRVKAIYQEFPDANLAEGWQCERAAVLEALSLFGKAHGMQVRPDQAERFSDLELINLLAFRCRFIRRKNRRCWKRRRSKTGKRCSSTYSASAPARSTKISKHATNAQLIH